MRRAWIAFVALPVLAATAASQGTAAPTPAPRGFAVLRTSIRAVEARLDALLALARMDPRLELVHAYLAFTPEQWKDSRRPVNVEKLLEILADRSASTEAREGAAAALGSETAKRQDPDLALVGKGLRRARAAFSTKLAKLLDDDDALSRGLAERVLESFWPQANEAAILQFNPRKEKTWKAAARAWLDYVKK